MVLELPPDLNPRSFDVLNIEDPNSVSIDDEGFPGDCYREHIITEMMGEVAMSHCFAG